MDAASGAYDVAQEASRHANEQLAELGVEIDVSTVTVMLSDSDREEVERARTLNDR
jgi:hypothetical protein